jgi:hypothetical protein
MDQSGREDPKLSEVKAVLHRLQGLTAEPEPADLHAAGPAPRRARWIGIAGFAIVGMAAALAIVFAFSKVRNPATSAPKGTPEAPALETAETTVAKAPREEVEAGKEAQTAAADSPSDTKAGAAPDAAKLATINAALEAAAGLMNSGRVQAARRRLLTVATDSSPDVALALARSYDPNVLAQIPAADASPDVAEAARWYRTWYAAAVKQGLSLDRMSLDRIIASMQR